MQFEKSFNLETQVQIHSLAFQVLVLRIYKNILIFAHSIAKS